MATLKSGFKLPGEAKRKAKPTGKLVLKPGEVLTRLSSKELRQLLGKGYPCYLDFSPPQFQIESDEFLLNCTNIVKEIDFTSNSLTEINSLEHLSKLKRVIIDKNILTSVSFKNLTNLEFLSLSQNRLSFLGDMNDLKKLINFNLSGNRLTSGFGELSKLKNLQVLDLGRNSIDFSIEQFYTFILVHLKTLPKLKYLSFEENPVEVKIPSFRLFVINELVKLSYLDWKTITKEERGESDKLAASGKWKDKANQVLPTTRQNSSRGSDAGGGSGARSEAPVLVDQSQLDSILNSLMDDVSGGTLPGDSGDEVLSTKSSSSAADLNYLDLLNEMISSTDTDITSSTLGVDDENLDSLTSSLSAEFGLLSASTSNSSSTLSGTTSVLSPSPSMEGKSSEAKIDYLDMLYELIEEDKGSEPPSSLSSTPSSLSSSSSLTRATTLSSLDSDSSLFDLIGEIMETPQSSASAPLDFDALAASITAELDVEEEQKRKNEEESIKKTEEEKKKKQEEKEKKKQEQAQKEEERKRLEQEEWERKRGELENWRKQEEERWRKEAEERSRQEEERRKREEEEWRKQREEEEKRRREEIERWKAEEERRRVEELERWKKEEEEKRDELRKAEALKQAAEEEKRKAEEIRRAIENERRIVQEEEERLRQIRLEEERKLREELDKFEEERKKRAEEERLRQIELSEQARKALEEKQRQLEEELRLQAESRAKEEELRKQREAEERRKQEEEWAKKREEYEQMVKRLDEEKRKREEEGRSALPPATVPITSALVPRPDLTSAPAQVEVSSETDEVRDLLNSLISSKSASDDTGINFQDLTLGERLGVGTFGAMSKGTWKGAEVSIKQLALRNITPALSDNLLIETPALKSVHHPNLVDFFGICVNKGSTYAVWDHVVGVSLHAFLRKSKIINFPFVIKTALGVANALQCLHNKNITHRTLNPKNILLDKKATIRINDYGLESVKTELGKAISLTCPEYSAPELLLQRNFNHQVDIYSFGVVLWELCTLQQPYAGLNPKQVILGVVQKGLRPPVPQNVPVVLGRLIQGCWSTDPNKRPTIGNIIKLLSQPQNLLLKQASGTIANQVAPTPVPLPRAVGVPTPYPVAKAAPSAKPAAIPAVKAAVPSPKPTTPALTPGSTPTPTPVPTPTLTPAAKPPVSNAASVVGRVLEYLKQPNPAAHVKALKALGNLVRTEENREALIEADSFGLIVQKLLAPEPDLQEEAARVLGVLADDGECTDLIREADGLKPLVGLLSSSNQAISFEALKTITKMVENDANKTQIRELGGIQALINLLQLDENFKMQSAWALSLILEDEENQKAFTTLGGVNALLALLNLQNPALQLRVLVGLGALMIKETNNAIRQAGVLQRFLKLLQSKSTNLQKHGVTGISRFSTLPDLRVAIFKLGGVKSLVDLLPSPDLTVVDLALKSLVNFASEASYCERLRGFNIMPALIGHLTSKSPVVVLETTRLLLPLVSDAGSKKELTASSIPTLTKLITSRNEELAKSSLLVLSAVSDAPESLKVLGDAEGIPALLNLLDSYDDQVKEAAAKIIADLSQHKENKDRIRTVGGIPRIVNLFASHDEKIKERAALCISNLSDDPENRKIVREVRGLYPLVELLHYHVDAVKERVAWSVANFLVDAESQPIVKEAGGFESILHLLSSSKSDSLISYSLKAILILAQTVTNRPFLVNAGARQALQPLTTSSNRTVALASQKALTFLQ